jgi:regulator of protease activity HflC (stomatin/prohibitin superfamily)
MVAEKVKSQFNGFFFLFLFIALLALDILGIVMSIHNPDPTVIIILSLVLPVIFICFGGFFTVEPNEGVVLLLFGKYIGTERTQGFRWTNPFNSKRKISLRARNFDGDRLKVNDLKGNPIEISSVVVWKVSDTAKAVFEVDSYTDYVKIQSESALRHLASIYPYDTYEDDAEISLRTSLDEVSEALKKEIQVRTGTAGVEILEARINHLSYATEIAQAMLRRQQAEAVIAARQKIVDGSVGMVEIALKRLQKEGVVELDEERKAAMVSNLMVVLCSEEATQPVINTGTLY